MLNRALFSMIALVPVLAAGQESYSPHAGQNYPANVYWGDTHLHTKLSDDAYAFGNRLGPEEAYRFAKGETVTANNGMQARLRRPLDFLVVADHAENLGVMTGLEAEDPLLKSEAAKRRLRRLVEINESGQRASAKGMALSLDGLFQGVIGEPAFIRSVWEQVTSNADRHNDPGRFTAFIGYEWTSFGANGSTSLATLHRNVIFKDGAEKANQIVPFSSYDSADPEALWEFLARYEQRSGGEVLAIPHNGNLSQGQQFALHDQRGRPLSMEYALTRRRWEPLYEITQMKGDSETHPLLSPTDEFADYEIWDMYPKPSTPENHVYEYARSALKLGLGQQAKLGVNPFKFGLIGSTDAHNSLSAVEESNYWGKQAIDEPSAQRLMLDPDRKIFGWQLSSAGYAAVWATENTREALFAAMKRKETYATTGPRMTVRFFGGWEYEKEDALRPDVARTGYRKGVPMGGDLTQAPPSKAPRFLIRAVRDPDGANLDRVQVIKGWRDTKGELHERIYNVALSDGRKEEKNGQARDVGQVAPVGNTVDVRNASYTNTIGDAELAVVWEDPDFNPKELAFYYVRVLEIPTPRWTAYDAKFFDIKNIPSEVPMITQERAYTSPIWYTPHDG